MTSTCPSCGMHFARWEREEDERTRPRTTVPTAIPPSSAIVVECPRGHTWIARSAERRVNEPIRFDLIAPDA